MSSRFSTTEKPLGLIGKDPADPRDYKLSEVQKQETDLPDSYLLGKSNIDKMIASLTSVQDQLYGDCTSHASDGVKEQQDSFEYDREIKLSQRFIYHNIKKLSGIWSTEGDFLRNGFKALEKWGVCLEETYPYKKFNDWKDYAKPEPPQEAYKEAKKYKIKNYYRVEPNLDDIRSAIYKNKAPIGVSMAWYKSYYSEKDDGYLPTPGDNKYGGHALIIVGWENNKLWFRNSHGTDYGYRGYFYIPFNELNKHELWDCWVSIDKIEDPRDNIGWVADSYLKVIKGFQAGDVVTPGYALNFRSKPYVSNDTKIDLLQPGEELKITGESKETGGYNWQKVRRL